LPHDSEYTSVAVPKSKSDKELKWGAKFENAVEEKSLAVVDAPEKITPESQVTWGGGPGGVVPHSQPLSQVPAESLIWVKSFH